MMNQATPPAVLAAPDLGPWRAGNTGTEGVWRFGSGAPGRELLVTALVHGNEVCGAWALAALLEAGLRPRRGAWTLAFVNLAAFDRFDPADPHASRCVDTDLNRLWGAMAWRRSVPPAAWNVEQRRVAALLPFVERADWLLDLHSMHAPGPALGLTGLLPGHAAQAASLGAPRLLVADAGHRAGARLRDHGRWSDAADGEAFALLVECGQHLEPSSRTVALDVLARFLEASGTVDAGDLPAGWRRPDAPGPVRHLRVTAAVTVEAGEPPRFTADWACGQVVPRAGTVIGFNAGRPLATPYDDCVLVMPSLLHAAPGQTMVRLAREEPAGA